MGMGRPFPHCHQRPNSLQCSSMENKKTVDGDTLEKLLYLSRLSKLREDSVVAGLDIPDVKKVTENFMDGYFQVPKVLGEGA